MLQQSVSPELLGGFSTNQNEFPKTHKHTCVFLIVSAVFTMVGNLMFLLANLLIKVTLLWQAATNR